LLENIKNIAKLLDAKIKSPKKIDNVFLAFYDIFLEHIISIDKLIEAGLVGSAFALVRPAYEALLRGHYIILHEEKLDSFEKGNNIFPNMETLTKELDNYYSEEPFFVAIKEKGWKAMNDYTHNAIRQIARRFDEEGNLISSYSKEEIEDIWKILNSWLFVYSYGLSKYFKLHAEADTIKKVILKLK
jgi:hypothetical protein